MGWSEGAEEVTNAILNEGVPMTHCPLGCDLVKTGCNHVDGARMVKHNDHWDHIIDDHLLHVFETDSGRMGMINHGVFEVLDNEVDFL